jgi:hypothetical protein
MEHVSFDRNIVQYYGVCMEGENAAMLVLEYMAVRLRKPVPKRLREIHSVHPDGCTSKNITVRGILMSQLPRVR